MRRALVLPVCLALISLEGCALHSISRARAEKRSREKEARETALHWLELVDSGDYESAYAEEPARLRAGGTEAQFVRSMNGRRAPFGRVISRNFIGAAFTRKLTGSPDGRYESILFRTRFEHKALAAERVILTRESRRWKVVDYRVY